MKSGIAIATNSSIALPSSPRATFCKNVKMFLEVRGAKAGILTLSRSMKSLVSASSRLRAVTQGIGFVDLTKLVDLINRMALTVLIALTEIVDLINRMALTVLIALTEIVHLINRTALTYLMALVDLIALINLMNFTASWVF